MASLVIPKAKMKAPIITPAGSALFCSGIQPSTYDDSKVEASIIITADEKDAIVEKIMAFVKEHKDSLGIDMKKFQMPITESTDKDKNPDGRFVLKAKSKLEYLPKFYDHSNVEFTPDINYKIPNGSTIRLKVTVELLKTSKFQGVTFRLQAYQILKLATMDSGFDAVEVDGGFDGTTASTAPEAPKNTEDAWE